MATTLNIDSRKLALSPAIETYVKEKLSKLDKIFVNKVTTVHVILSIDNYRHNAEAEVKIAGDPNRIFAHATSKDLYESIDMLEHKLYEQVAKYHSKLTDHDKKKHNK